MFPNVQNSKLQVDADSETNVHTDTQQNLLMKANIQDRFLFTIHRMMNDRCNCENFSRMTRPNTERDFIISRTSTFYKKKIRDLHLELPRLDLRISEIQTLQYSRKDLSTGL